MRKNYFLICLFFSLVISTFAQTTILSETFQTGSPPTGWTMTQATGSDGWMFGTALGSDYFSIPSHTRYAASNDDNCDCDMSLDYLISPAMNLSTYSTVFLTFEGYFDGAYESTTHVKVSTNGGTTWTNLYNLEAASEWQSILLDLSAYTTSNVKIGFHHNDHGAWGSGFAIDNFEVLVPPALSVSMLSVNLPDLVAVGNTDISGTIKNLGGDVITSIENPVFNSSQAGNQSLTYTVTDDNGCSWSNSILVNVYSFDHTEAICIVTVDNSTNLNRVVWEKIDGIGIAYYVVYKENTSGIYDSIGKVSFADESSYLDINSTPETQPEKYKIAARDNFANISGLSPYHQSMNLNAAQGIPTSSVDLSWNSYLDDGGVVTPTYYYIYQGTTLGNIAVIDSVAGSVTTYTLPNAAGSLFYAIGIRISGSCDPQASNNQTYSSSMSNIVGYDNILGNDATLIDLLINDTTVAGFSPITVTYNVFRASSTVPTVVGIPSDSNATVVVTGPTSIPGTSTLVVTAEDGVTGKTYTVNFTIGNSIGELTDNWFPISIFPNPFSTSTTLSFENKGNETFTLRVIDVTGKTVLFASDIKGTSYLIDRKGLQSGLYFIELVGSKVFMGKMIVK